jgi:hypothetical protein
MGIGGIDGINFGTSSGKKSDRFGVDDNVFLESLLAELDNEETTSDVVKQNKVTTTKSNDLSALAARSILGEIPDISGDITPQELAKLSDMEAIKVLNPIINKYLNTLSQTSSAG